MCMCVCLFEYVCTQCVYCSQNTVEGVGASVAAIRGCLSCLWMLRTEARFSGRVQSAFNCWVIISRPCWGNLVESTFCQLFLTFFNMIIWFFSLPCWSDKVYKLLLICNIFNLFKKLILFQILYCSLIVNVFDVFLHLC